MDQCLNKYSGQTFGGILKSNHHVKDDAGLLKVAVLSTKNVQFYAEGAGASSFVTLREVGNSENTFRMYASDKSVADLDIMEEWCRKKNEELSKKQT